MRDLLLGLAIGAAAGISPGPLLVLVITATLRSGWRAGAAAALSPLATDLVVVTLTLAVLDRIPTAALAWIGVVGGFYVGYLGISTVRGARQASLTMAQPAVGTTFAQACAVNITSPHPWLTWATALGPLTVATYHRGAGGAVGLVLGFYTALVGAKMLVAALVAGTRHRLSDRGYRMSLRIAGVVLLVLGVALVWEFGRVALAPG